MIIKSASTDKNIIPVKTAPYCNDCHAVHDVQSQKNISSPTFARNVPELCGKCHREGLSIAATKDASNKGIIANYKESIHGKGLIQSGLLCNCNLC